MPKLSQRLEGGDRRSIGIANKIATEALAAPALLNQLIDGMFSDSPLIRMRSSDALEKASRIKPDILKPYKKIILNYLKQMPPDEVLWHLLQMAGRITWTGAERRQVIRIVNQCLQRDSSIVKTCALQTIFDLLPQAPNIKASVIRLLQSNGKRGTPAMKARAKKLLLQLQD